MTRLFCILVSPFILSACGGGGGGGPVEVSEPTPDTYTVQEVYNDGSGISRSTNTINGNELVGTYYLANVSSTDIDSNQVANFTRIAEVGSGTNGTYYTATATVNDQTVNVYLYEATNGENIVIAAEGCSGPCVAALGDAPSNLPTGTWTYTGDMVGWSEGVTDLSDPDEYTVGPFTMAVNFNTGKASVSSTSNDGKAVLASNNLSVDMSTGQLTGDGTVVSPLAAGGSGNEWDVDINGSFHGNGATSVSGVIGSTQQTLVGPENQVGHINGAFSGTRSN